MFLNKNKLVFINMLYADDHWPSGVREGIERRVNELQFDTFTISHLTIVSHF